MLNTWNKFCFTGGIIEISAIMPGDPTSGGLWPAMWLLGNLGRATYEASTNKVWPWSFDVCDRDLQHAQEISACNNANHYGLIPGRGRGSTEIDILEIMPGEQGFLPSTTPKVERPYGAMTLQVAPGVTKNRPNSGQAPVRVANAGTNGHPPAPPQSWYENLGFGGNTSVNPFFYGTWLGETKPNEPVHRTKLEAYQADAVGAMHQMKEAHFEKAHTYRLEWQPGKGGRIDWYVQDTQEDARVRPEGYSYERASKKKAKDKTVKSDYASPEKKTENGWTRAFSIRDSSLWNLTNSQIPEEPSYLIFNTAVSSTWGFPYDVPDTCKKCYDCNDPDCACAMPVGFCDSLKDGKASMLIDYVRVYQSKDHSSHVGGPHTLGCDPINFPTKEFIAGHEYRYVRPLPFVDKKPLKSVRRGGGTCGESSDGGTGKGDGCGEGGECKSEKDASFWSNDGKKMVCVCRKGWTGPKCKSRKYHDDAPGAYEYELNTGWFLKRIASPYVPIPLLVTLCAVVIGFLTSFWATMQKKKISGGAYMGATGGETTPLFNNRIHRGVMEMRYQHTRNSSYKN